MTRRIVSKAIEIALFDGDLAFSLELRRKTAITYEYAAMTDDYEQLLIHMMRVNPKYGGLAGKAGDWAALYFKTKGRPENPNGFLGIMSEDDLENKSPLSRELWLENEKNWEKAPKAYKELVTGKQDAWEVVFTVDGSTRDTGRGKPLSVLSTVIMALEDFMYRQKPKYIYFEPTDAKRGRIYKTMFVKYLRGVKYKLLKAIDKVGFMYRKS